MKRIFFYLLVLAATLPMSAQELKTHLVIWAKDGTQVAYALKEQPVISFTDKDLQVKTTLVEVNYPLAQLARYAYETREEATGLYNLQTGEPVFQFIGESLVFPYLETNNTVSIYTPLGQLLLSRTITSAGDYAFPLSYLTTGVYMVNVNGITYKIVKQ
jgi:hypothetical protein